MVGVLEKENWRETFYLVLAGFAERRVGSVSVNRLKYYFLFIYLFILPNINDFFYLKKILYNFFKFFNLIFF